MEKRTISAIRPTVRAAQRADGSEGRVCEGYAAVYYDGTDATQYELWSGYVERIMPKAFDRAIREDDVRALFNHDPDHVLGRTSSKTLNLSSDSKGLRYQIQLPDTTLARDLVALLERGDVSGSSFAFDVVGEEWRKEGGVYIREITEARVYDVGPVTFPAYETTTSGVRSADGLADARKACDAWQARVRAAIAAAQARARCREIAVR